jgi:hypothetical protein
MSNHEQQICDKLLDTIVTMNPEDLSSADMEHLQSCELCQETLESINQLRVAGSPFKKEYYPLQKEELKNRILIQATPILNSLAKANKTTSSESWSLITLGFKKPLLAFASFFAVVALVVYVMGVHTNPQRDIMGHKGYESIKLASIPTSDSSVYKIIEKENIKLIPLDNPISLFNNEKVDIELPDGSTATLTGPARMTICQRGFHLIQGDLFIEVKKDQKTFLGTTPHCEIAVLGTSFNCKVNSKATEVEVKTGKVAVTSNEQLTKTLEAGESTMVKETNSFTHSDSIAPKDSE